MVKKRGSLKGISKLSVALVVIIFCAVVLVRREKTFYAAFGEQQSRRSVDVGSPRSDNHDGARGAELTTTNKGERPLETTVSSVVQDKKKPRKIYIDLGANCGNTYWRIRDHSAKGSEDTLNPPEDWEAYLWEANPQLNDWYLKDLVATEPNVELIPKAAMTERGNVTFYLTAGQERLSKDAMPNSQCDPHSPYQPGGASSLYGSAKRAGEAITVQGEDFFAWFQQLQLQQGDVVHMKIDIEGAELPILKKFLADDANQICHWKVFWMEYHKNIFPQGTVDYEQHEEFEKDFPAQFEAKCGFPLWPNVWA